MPARSPAPPATPDATLRALVARLAPAEQRLVRALRTALRKRLPRANELLYDYGRFMVLSYSPTEHGIHGVVALSARPDGVYLYFLNGPKLRDPEKLLQGTGRQTRFIRVESARVLAVPAVEALVKAAIEAAPVPFAAGAKGRLIVRTDGTKKRPKAKPAKRARSRVRKGT